MTNEQYLDLINSTPALLSLLYDANLLPEQINTTQDSISMSAICLAYLAGKDAATTVKAP